MAEFWMGFALGMLTVIAAIVVIVILFVVDSRRISAAVVAEDKDPPEWKLEEEKDFWEHRLQRLCGLMAMYTQLEEMHTIPGEEWKQELGSLELEKIKWIQQYYSFELAQIRSILSTLAQRPEDPS